MGTSYTPTDIQKIKLEKLMKNIDKPIEINTRPKNAKFAEPPDFIRNIMGSSAGAGSGEFHVYRHLRRKEYARQRFIEEQAKKEELDEKYHKKLEDNLKNAEERTAKKRAKRLKKKEKLKKLKIAKKNINKKEECKEENLYQKQDDKDDELIVKNDSISVLKSSTHYFLTDQSTNINVDL